MSGGGTIPFTIAFAHEEVKDLIVFEWHDHECRLAYERPRLDDRVHGILRGRVRDLLDRPDLRGPARMRKLNTRRQWRCMDELLCQVCGEPARDPWTGRIPWVLPSTVFERTGPDRGRTNAPPTCWSCMPKALEECPMLRKDSALCAVTRTVSAGVLADLYQPRGLAVVPSLSRHHVFVAWDAHRYHGRALAVAQVLELRGMTALPDPGRARSCPVRERARTSSSLRPG